MTRLLVVQHEPSAPPGLLAPAAAATGVELQVVEAPDQPVPVTLDGTDGLVVLGGVMDADETDAYPHLARTMDLVRDAAARSAPTLGICLGAQLAAAALGGRAYPGPAGEELGWTKVELTEAGRADPVTGALQEPAELFEWHHDTFDPPPGATLLAGGAVYPGQAFRLGSVVAVQFHPEVDGPLLAGWWAESTPPPSYPIAEALAGVARNTANATRLLEAFCRVAVTATAGGRRR
ncbi:MAG TPA: type 1 glutamine amidotransferase [Actinomycetota bacterium]|jgi:GMP synthase (glutamine-hydrolysing)|nr:type 1 glutamine amidotransferase [Actinomycetota bacterium]